MKLVEVKRFLAFFIVSCLAGAGYGVQAQDPVAETGDVAANEPEIRIGIIGDQTGTTDLNQAYATMAQGVQVLSGQNLDVVIHVGDLLESSASENEIRAQFTQAKQILDQLPVPWYLTAGDHDVNPPGFQQDSNDRSRETLFKQLYGARVPQVLAHPYYSFDVNNYHFVSLYSLEALHSDPRWGNVYINEISNAQFQWLSQDLENHSTARAIVVFLHHPMWYNWSGWQRVHNLLRRYPVAAVVAGHFHYDQEEGYIDGIRYAVVGATGATVKNGDRDAGDVQHVSVLTVKRKPAVRFRLISLSDNLPLVLTPRKDMDKIQAMDLVLGELWNFAFVNPVFRRANGSLTNACGSSDPAKIEIQPIGNPTDKSMKVQVRFSADDSNVALSSPGFTPGECKTVINSFECVLARSARIFVANNSSVSVNTFAPPLWRTNLASSGPGPHVGTALNFDIRLDYEGKSGPLFLERRATTTVQSCP